MIIPIYGQNKIPCLQTTNQHLFYKQTSFTLDSNSQRSALELSAQTDPSDDRIMSDPTIPLSCEAKHREVLESGWEVRDFFFAEEDWLWWLKNNLEKYESVGITIPNIWKK